MMHHNFPRYNNPGCNLPACPFLTNIHTSSIGNFPTAQSAPCSQFHGCPFINTMASACGCPPHVSSQSGASCHCSNISSSQKYGGGSNLCPFMNKMIPQACYCKPSAAAHSSCGCPIRNAVCSSYHGCGCGSNCNCMNPSNVTSCKCSKIADCKCECAKISSGQSVDCGCGGFKDSLVCNCGPSCNCTVLSVEERSKVNECCKGKFSSISPSGEAKVTTEESMDDTKENKQD